LVQHTRIKIVASIRIKDLAILARDQNALPEKSDRPQIVRGARRPRHPELQVVAGEDLSSFRHLNGQPEGRRVVHVHDIPAMGFGIRPTPFQRSRLAGQRAEKKTGRSEARQPERRARRSLFPGP
jgi:hypothetical protein